MTYDAVCLQCGAAKALPWWRCRRCGFDPSPDEEALAKSAYLSVQRFDQPRDQAVYRKELRRIGVDIGRGIPPTFDSRELARLKAAGATQPTVPPWRVVWWALFKITMPGLLILVALLCVVLLLRWAR
jgi:hypothetical protein